MLDPRQGPLPRPAGTLTQKGKKVQEAAGGEQTEKSPRPRGSSLFRKDTLSWGLPLLHTEGNGLWKAPRCGRRRLTPSPPAPPPRPSSLSLTSSRERHPGERPDWEGALHQPPLACTGSSCPRSYQYPFQLRLEGKDHEHKNARMRKHRYAAFLPRRAAFPCTHQQAESCTPVHTKVQMCKRTRRTPIYAHPCARTGHTCVHPHVHTQGTHVPH